MPINRVHRDEPRATSPDPSPSIVAGAPSSLSTGRCSTYPGRLAAAAVTAVAAAGIALNDAQSSAALARTLVVAFVFLAPAIVITGLLPSVSTAVALIVAAAGAAAINALVAQAMLSANVWSRPAGVIAVGLITAVLWLVPITRGRS